MTFAARVGAGPAGSGQLEAWDDDDGAPEFSGRRPRAEICRPVRLHHAPRPRCGDGGSSLAQVDRKGCGQKTKRKARFSLSRVEVACAAARECKPSRRIAKSIASAPRKNRGGDPSASRKLDPRLATTWWISGTPIHAELFEHRRTAWRRSAHGQAFELTAPGTT